MIHEIPLERIAPNPEQPRRDFPEEHISDLAQSIKANGLLQPIRVTPRNGHFLLIAGECRYRAHQRLRMPTIRAEVVEASDAEVAVSAIVENMQRRDVTPLEEAMAFQSAINRFGYTPAELALKLGLKQPWRVEERLSLLRLRPEYQKLLKSGQLGASQAFELSRLSHHNQDKLFKLIKAGQCDTYNRLRAAANGLVEAQSQGEMFALPKPTEAETARLNALEKRIGQVCTVLAAGFDKGEIVIAKKIAPDRAAQIADQLKLIGKHVADLEKALRSTAAQAELVSELL